MYYSILIARLIRVNAIIDTRGNIDISEMIISNLAYATIKQLW